MQFEMQVLYGQARSPFCCARWKGTGHYQVRKNNQCTFDKTSVFFLLGTWDHSEGQTVSSVSASTLVHKSLSCWGETAVHGVRSRAYPRLHWTQSQGDTVLVGLDLRWRGAERTDTSWSSFFSAPFVIRLSKSRLKARSVTQAPHVCRCYPFRLARSHRSPSHHLLLSLVMAASAPPIASHGRGRSGLMCGSHTPTRSVAAVKDLSFIKWLSNEMSREMGK
jgi:hypothetical protein